MSNKTCKACHQSKDRTEFWKHGGFKDGLHSSCKSCEKVRSRERARTRSQRRDIGSASHKLCSKCKAEKPLEDFFKDKTKKLGVSSACKSCSLERYRRWCLDNPDRAKEIQTQSSIRRRRGLASYYTFWVAVSGYDISAYKRRYVSLNAQEISRKAAERRRTSEYKVWKKENSSRRRQRLKYSSPLWADRAAIMEFYKNCPPGFEVDHIIPLKGRYVSGLHVVENLQYLTRDENLKKGNRFHIHPF